MLGMILVGGMLPVLVFQGYQRPLLDIVNLISGSTTVSSNDNNDKNVLEGIERISIVVKSLFGDMADMKNLLVCGFYRGPGR